MRVVDLYTQQEVSSTQIGQELQLVIELKHDDGETGDHHLTTTITMLINNRFIGYLGRPLDRND